MDNSLGLYLSVPFCKAKCSFCNFASDVFSPARMDRYVERLCDELRGARAMAERIGARLPDRVDTLYFGGGTPSLLEADHLRQIFAAIRAAFEVVCDAEVTLEAAPGQVAPETLAAAMRLGVNRVSFGVQSFVDREAAAVGRQHTGPECLAEIARMHSAGVERVSLDLIAGLPYQTAESWDRSLDAAVESGVEHMSVYLLEIDGDSRLGREALSGGGRYHAAAIPDDDETADRYGTACDRLGQAGVRQYEISNFARPGFESRHNVKYWERRPYLGVGLDAHSMLLSGDGGPEGTAVRWSVTKDFDEYMRMGEPGARLRLFAAREAEPKIERVGVDQALEEELFLGLRLNAGVDLERLGTRFGAGRLAFVRTALGEVEAAGLIERTGAGVRLTATGRLASNEVFSRLLVA